eukprot:278180_1
MPKKRKRGSSIGQRRKGKKSYSKAELAAKAAAQARREARLEKKSVVSPSVQSPSSQAPLPSVENANVASSSSRSKKVKVNYDEGGIITEAPLFNEASRRIMIAGYFVYRHKMDSNKDNWHGKGGIISDIKKTFDIPRGTDISNILKTVLICAKNGKKYDGSKCFS